MKLLSLSCLSLLCQSHSSSSSLFRHLKSVRPKDLISLFAGSFRFICIPCREMGGRDRGMTGVGPSEFATPRVTSISITSNGAESSCIRQQIILRECFSNHLQAAVATRSLA